MIAAAAKPSITRRTTALINTQSWGERHDT
jgi:hypothetical protein